MKYDYKIQSFTLDITDLDAFNQVTNEKRSDFINQIFNEVGFQITKNLDAEGHTWEIVSHDATFVGEYLVVTILLRRPE